MTDKTSPMHAQEMQPVEMAGSSVSSASKEVVVTIIEAGVNKSGTRFYSPSMLENHAKMFEGTKMYVDHLTPQQEKALGGMPRSVRDLVATLKETWWDAGSQSVKGRAKVVQDWFMELLLNDPTAVGVSIDVLGTSRNGVIGGQRLRVAESFTKARSVDFVTLPGAGGKIDSILEAHKTEVDLMALETITLADLKEHRPDLIQEAVLETASTTTDNGGAAEDMLTKEDVSEMIREAVAEATETVKANADKLVAQANHRAAIKEALAASRLPENSQTAIYESLHDAEFAATEDKASDEVCKEAVTAAIETKKAEIKEWAGSARVSGMGASAAMFEAEGADAPVSTPIHDSVMQAIGIKPAAAPKAGE